MQTPDPRDAADASPTPAEADATPAVDALLHRSAQGDRASFSAFYDATVPWVHGLAAAMFARPQDAAEATARTYLTAWEEAGEAELDLAEQDGPHERERRVFSWLGVLAHRVMTDLIRSGTLPAPARAPEHRPAALPEELAGQVRPEAYDAVRLAWLGGLTDAQTAERLGLPLDRARTLLRDGVRELVAAERAAHGRPAAETPQAPALGATVQEDAAAGRGAELADLSALHALDTAGHTAAVSAAQGRGAGELALWRSRVSAGRRAVAWAFRDVVAEPPSALLDEVLGRLPAQDVGMELVEEHRAPHPPQDRRRPLKVALMLLLGLMVIAAGVWALWSQFTPGGIQHRVVGADDLYTTSEVPARGGGSVQGFLSKHENSGYLLVSGMPQLPEGQAYQVWLYPEDGTAPASLGVWDDSDLDGPVTFRGLDGFAAASITVEPADGSEVPTGEPLLGLDLDPAASVGPQYGGRPSNG
ncbi:anti-sigma factor domain-containing protein [Micrococcus sp.]|uniref:anti-sigma factor domain-containing protein n=1 Tax=Micrococcus sp. TaxID=1271 RepID=UPI002A918F55|nr:anti-sigma factor [Micrococcus sp.]MDY6055883.1 anti-sigma factor [Micrococcus sp.]